MKSLSIFEPQIDKHYAYMKHVCWRYSEDQYFSSVRSIEFSPGDYICWEKPRSVGQSQNPRKIQKSVKNCPGHGISQRQMLSTSKGDTI